jgi:AraC-like DNA-binding protein
MNTVHKLADGIEIQKITERKQPYHYHLHHNYYELRILISGKEKFVSLPRTTIEGEQVIAGDILMLNPDEPHQGSLLGSNHSSYRLYYIPRSLMREYSSFSGIKEEPYFKKLIIKNQELFTRLLEIHQALDNSSVELNLAIQSKNSFVKIHEHCQNIKLFKEKLRMALIDLIDLYSCRKTLFLESRSMEQVEYIKKYLLYHYKENESLDKVAQKLHISTSTLAHNFSSRLNITPDLYRRMLKLEHSKSLLAEGKAVSDVSELVGFKNLSHFSLRFKHFFGLTPLTYKGCLVNEDLLF